MLEILANQAAATIQLIKDKEQQRQLAVRDGLTGLYNRRAFNELLVGRDRQRGPPAGRAASGLVILDLDHFKKLNDTYGHPAGDAALRSLARLLDQHLRKGDQAARYGGEEFVVILPGSDEERSMGAAERLRARAREAPLRLRGRAHPAHRQLRGRHLARRTGRSPRPSCPRPTAPSTPPSRPAATAWWPPPAVRRLGRPRLIRCRRPDASLP